MTEPRTRDQRTGVFVRLSPDDKQRAQYWADKRGYHSLGEYVGNAVAEKIARENADYDLPTLEIARLGQVVDELKALSVNVASLEHVTTSGFDSLIGLTRGDNYLLDDTVASTATTLGSVRGGGEGGARSA